ncbi:MAG: hypothetical protein ACLUUB_05730 [Collinsella sp.]
MSVKPHARRKSLAFMPVFNSGERVTGHFLYQDHVIGCQRIKALQVALENLSCSASSISSTGLPRQIPMSLRSDSSSTDMTFAGTARAPPVDDLLSSRQKSYDGARAVFRYVVIDFVKRLCVTRRRSKVNRWQQRTARTMSAPVTKRNMDSDATQYSIAIKQADISLIHIKEEVDALLNIDSFKLINEPPRGFPLITT